MFINGMLRNPKHVHVFDSANSGTEQCGPFLILPCVCGVAKVFNVAAKKGGAR